MISKISLFNLLNKKTTKSDSKKTELFKSSNHRLSLLENSLSQLKRNWKKEHLLGKLDNYFKNILIQKKRLLQGPILSFLHKETTSLNSRAQALRALDPQKNLERGYALIENDQGQNISHIKDLKSGQKIISRVKDGKIISTINQIQS